MQGKLSALMDSYLRPVLVERRLPTGYCQAVGRGLQPQAMLEDGLQQGTRSARRDEERPKSPTARGRSASGSASVDEEAESEDHFSFAASTASKVSNSSASKVTSDTSKAVRRLFVTRGDLLQVLKRLPQQALQSQGGCSTQAESLLKRSRCCGEFAPLWSLEFPKSWFRIARPATHQHWLAWVLATDMDGAIRCLLHRSPWN